jgi:hypothetical protein
MKRKADDTSHSEEFTKFNAELAKFQSLFQMVTNSAARLREEAESELKAYMQSAESIVCFVFYSSIYLIWPGEIGASCVCFD